MTNEITDEATFNYYAKRTEAIKRILNHEMYINGRQKESYQLELENLQMELDIYRQIRQINDELNNPINDELNNPRYNYQTQKFHNAYNGREL